MVYVIQLLTPTYSSLPCHTVLLLIDWTGKVNVSGLVRDCCSVYGSDLVAAPTRLVQPPSPSAARALLRFGTVGSGLDVIRSVWPQGQHVFSSQSSDLDTVLPRRPGTVELGPPGRVPIGQLVATPVDVLWVDLTEFDRWETWIERAHAAGTAPKAVAWVTNPAKMVDPTAEEKLHHRGKRLAAFGYSVRFWFLRAHEHGVALHQDRLVILYFLQAEGDPAPQRPIPTLLPARSMTNLLMPTGIPRTAFLDGSSRLRAAPIGYDGPCVVIGQVGSNWVYGDNGLMPDDLHGLVEVREPKRYRRLQSEELAKAKGVPSEWYGQPKVKPLAKAVAAGTSLHLLTAVGDSLTAWFDGTADPVSLASRTEPGAAPAVTPVVPPDEEDEDIPWEVPDLSRGEKWHQERRATLERAVESLPNAQQLLDEGEVAMDVHRANYTSEGPQRLQLLWWEFPPEHWEALRVGSSMNFLITPSGELELNSAMDPEQLAVAAQFVDELVSLGVLVEAEEPLTANGPLFLVPSRANRVNGGASPT
jgi:hypothetical protein